MDWFLFPLLVWLIFTVIASTILYRMKKSETLVMIGSLVSFFALILSFIVFAAWSALSYGCIGITINNMDFREHTVTIDCPVGPFSFRNSCTVKPNSSLEFAPCKCFFTLPNITVTLDDKIRETYEVRAMGYIKVRITNESGLRMDIIQGPVI